MKRQRSVGEMIRAVEKKKRVTSPKQVAQMATGERDSNLLAEIQKIQTALGSEIAGLWDKIEKRFDSFESRLEKLEGDIFARDKRIDELENEVRACHRQIAGFEDQLEDMERHSRSVNLVLRSMEFGKRKEGEDIKARTVQILKENFPQFPISGAVFTAVHRLGSENCVICAFADKNLRNAIYDERLSLRNRNVDGRKRLYVNESLTKNKAQIFNRLLALKKEQRIWSVYTRGGIPIAKLLRESPPTKVHSLQQLALIERGLTARLAAAAGPPPSGGGGPAAGPLLRPRARAAGGPWSPGGAAGSPGSDRPPAGAGRGPPVFGGGGAAGRPLSELPPADISAGDAPSEDPAVASAAAPDRDDTFRRPPAGGVVDRTSLGTSSLSSRSVAGGSSAGHNVGKQPPQASGDSPAAAAAAGPAVP